MSTDSLQTEIGSLVAGGQLEKAAKRLEQFFERTDPERRQWVLQLQRRLHTLKAEYMRGVLSREDRDVELARISEALLWLCRQKTDASPEPPRYLRQLAATPQAKTPLTTMQWVWLSAAVVSILAVLGVWYWGIPAATEPFNLTVYIQGPAGAAEAPAVGAVQVRLGSFRTDFKEVNSDGEVTFRNIPRIYREAPIELIPKNASFRVLQQSAETAADSETITFELQPLAHWRGLVRDTDGHPVSGARVDVGPGLVETTTDAQGHFQVDVPRPAGSRVQVEVWVDGQLRRRNSYVLTGSDDRAPIILNEAK